MLAKLWDLEIKFPNAATKGCKRNSTVGCSLLLEEIEQKIQKACQISMSFTKAVYRMVFIEQFSMYETLLIGPIGP